uniref:Uncharacterized protein n=1 Tax=Chrysemys picta bellii TaxID=8478 RepID=A0A8C3HQ27_CHRPI
MAFLGNTSKLFLVLISLMLMLPVVEALDAGDAIALLLGIVLTIIGFCACLDDYFIFLGMRGCIKVKMETSYLKKKKLPRFIHSESSYTEYNISTI